ncbi:MAG: hypothetical protein L6R41_007389 [Letrouitia leprolyta]|nr:MAG: hypothetical protein L6R41_007389 [Letrouitia leprolyta]
MEVKAIAHAADSMLLARLEIPSTRPIHTQLRGEQRLIDDGEIDESTRSEDLSMITDSPGPPTIQPGIPAIQPSIPTSGVPSMNIPPLHQTSSSRSYSKDTPAPSKPESSILSAAVPTKSTSPTLTASSIPYLSELMSQLFPQSSKSTGSSILVHTPDPTSSPSRSSTAATPTTPKITTQSATPSISSKDGPLMTTTAPTGPTLVYSFQLPPYSGGLDISGIAETAPVSSPAEDTHQPAATIYSYSLPPYTPKVPTYVASSAGIAPVSMTSGAPGAPTANARATKNLLSQGSVDPTKDLPPLATSTIIPLYSPACLGNAYGGGYVITPTLSAANTNVTSVGKIPPAYGFSYKLESPGSATYSAAVIIADTKAATSVGSFLPTSTSVGSSVGALIRGSSSYLGGPSQTFPASTNGPLAASGGLDISSDQSSSITSFPAIASSSASLGIRPEAGPSQSIETIVNSSCITITTLATSSYLVNAAGSTIATLGSQNQIHGVATGYGSASTDTTKVPSPELFRAQLNETFTLPGNALEVSTSSGASPKLISSGLGAFPVLLRLFLAIGIM